MVGALRRASGVAAVDGSSGEWGELAMAGTPGGAAGLVFDPLPPGEPRIGRLRTASTKAGMPASGIGVSTIGAGPGTREPAGADGGEHRLNDGCLGGAPTMRVHEDGPDTRAPRSPRVRAWWAGVRSVPLPALGRGSEGAVCLGRERRIHPPERTGVPDRGRLRASERRPGASTLQDPGAAAASGARRPAWRWTASRWAGCSCPSPGRVGWRRPDPPIEAARAAGTCAGDAIQAGLGTVLGSGAGPRGKTGGAGTLVVRRGEIAGPCPAAPRWTTEARDGGDARCPGRPGRSPAASFPGGCLPAAMSCRDGGRWTPDRVPLLGRWRGPDEGRV